MKSNRIRRLLPALGVALFLALGVVFALLYQANRTEPVSGSKHITVEVIHRDGTERSFAYDTDADYLSEVLLDEGLVSGAEGPFGLYVETVDGETASYETDGSWWALSINGTFAETGADATPVHDGDAYTWTWNRAAD